MSYLELSMNFPVWVVGESAIWNALERRGYEQWLARSKPLLTVDFMGKRLPLPERQFDWNLLEWLGICWTGETLSQ